MNQDTYVPGMNGAGQAPQPGLYANPNVNGGSTQTYIPSMNAAPAPTAAKPSTGAPVVGFLYSISRDGFPEYWPLYVGVNKIGKGADMDIRLCEKSVSDHHANLNIKRMRTAGNRLVASIIDVGSKNGVMLNDEELDFDPHSCKTDDIIVIGCNYKLLLLLADPVHYKLEVAPDFQPSEEEPVVASAPALHVGPAVPPPVPFTSTNDTVNINGGYVDGLDAGGTVTL